MSAKKWLISFLCCVLGVAALVCGINLLIDPFGVFGDPLLDWYSFDMTNNPRAAKIAYLDRRHGDYDSYLIGCSSTSSFPVAALEQYTGERFYNMFCYGADTYDMYQTALYVLDHYEPKSIFLNLSVMNAFYYDYENDPLTDSNHAKVDGSPLLPFYLRFLFANPKYAIAKLKDRAADTYLTQPFDVFAADTGAYDKKVRDVEPIGDLDRYLDAYPVFRDYPKATYSTREAERCLAAVTEIKERCDAQGVTLTVVFSPLYWEHAAYFPADQVRGFLGRLAQITPFWDFSYSSVSFEPRYFYDSTHFRNSVGDMALSKIYGGVLFCPEDFGTYVTAENAAAYLANYRTETFPMSALTETAQVPILTYHHVAEGASSTVISPEMLESHFAALREAGYQAVFLSQLRDYVFYGTELPEKPVVITFDDGYLSNCTEALPLLEKYDLKATIFIIGVSFGKDTYKDTENAITPHFGTAEAWEMLTSGRIEFGSHTYDLHQWPPFETEEPVRENLKLLPGDTEEDYLRLLIDDIAKFSAMYAEDVGGRTVLFSYPYGEVTTEAAVALNEAGYQVTVTTAPGVNTLVQGLPQSLLGLRRFTVSGEMTSEDVLALLNNN